MIQNGLIVRYRHGMPIYPKLDLQDKLKEALEHIKKGFKLHDLIKPINDGSGWGIHSDSTWFRIIQEVLNVFEQPSEGRGDREKALLCVLEALCSSKKDEEILDKLKTKVLKHVDLLSGWSHSFSYWHHQINPVLRKEGKYYVQMNGQMCEIIGMRTEKEERWDYVADSCLGTYGEIQSLFKLVALLNICLDFQLNPKQYPPSMLIVLPENSGAHFLHWKWHVKWPYYPRPINWRPDNNLCDPKWLASDLLCSFSDLESIPEKEIGPAEWKGPERKVIEQFSKFSGQVEFALDTNLRFGDIDEVSFNFRDMTIRWVNQTENRHTILILPITNPNDYKEERELAMRFLSRLAFDTNIPINVITSYGGPVRFYPMLRQPKRLGGIMYPADYKLRTAESFSNKQDLAHALYKEGLSSSSVYYSFLSFYKVIQLAFGENRERISIWINDNLDKISYPPVSERIKEIINENFDIGDYLYISGRCAIAHVSHDPIIDPDKPENKLRLNKDLNIVKGLARHAIESGLFNPTENQQY